MSETTSENGLSTAQAEAARARSGFNETPAERRHPLADFLGKFRGISAWMLELIMLLSAVLGKYPDMIVVGVLLVFNAVVSFTQERRAAGVVESLRRRLGVTARVFRDAAWKLLPSRELVPGDRVRLRSGDIIPADLRLLEGALSVDQSALTGESKDAEFGAGGLLSSGSLVRRGEGDGLVLTTGAGTALGRTTELVRRARPKLHIEAVIARVVRWLFLIVGSLILLMLLLAAARGQSLLQVAPLALVLLLSAVPVALPVMFTVSLAAGAKELSLRGVLVTRQSAAEDAATMDVLLVDKTGTITQNRMTVVDVAPYGSATPEDLLAAGAGASQESDQDPIDLAILSEAKQRGIGQGSPASAAISFKPFDPETRSTEALVERHGARFRLVKGAVGTVALECGLAPAAIEALNTQVSGFAARGCRCLAVAEGPEGGPMALLGLVTLRDPPRDDAKALVVSLGELGVSVKMLTGDEVAVAAEIGRGVGLPDIRGAGELKSAMARSGPEAVALLAGIDGLAGVYPEDKYTVVKLLQAGGHLTGMTGDGVNDAPALRQAEVGIAVSGATDVARGAASVVLVEPGLTNILDLIRQGRMIYQRVLTWIINKISRTVLKAGFVVVAYVATGKFVVSAFAMLLLTFMTDFHNITLATDRVRPSRKPETWNIGGFVSVSAALGLAMLAEALLFLSICWRPFGLAGDGGRLQSFSFLLLFDFAVFSLLSVRERRRFWATKPSRTLLAALATDTLVATGLTRAGLPGFGTLSWGQTWATLAFTALAGLGVNDAIKVAMLRGMKIVAGAQIPGINGRDRII
jgi:plasma-membrane proton-efflux P-type ATPase